MPTTMDEDVRADLRAGTLGAATLGGLLTLGLLWHGQLLYALVALPSTLLGIWLARIALVGFMYPLASAAGRIVATAAGEERPIRPMARRAAEIRQRKHISPPPAAYAVDVRCGCGASLTLDARVSTEAQRAMLTSFFPAHDACVARALDHEPNAPTLTITVTCQCGEQVCVDVVEMPSEHMQRVAAEFIAGHRHCARGNASA